jgi:hypothetical protein
MMCFEDRTWCPFYANCQHGDTCSRSLTPAVQEAANKWWGHGGAPIAVFVEAPKCFIAVKQPEEVV